MIQTAGGIILAMVILGIIALSIGLLVSASQQSEEDERKRNGYKD